MYKKVCPYLNLISYYPGEFDIKEQGFYDVEVKRGTPLDKVFYEDLYRPIGSHMNGENPIHLRNDFRELVEYLTLFAKKFILDLLYYGNSSINEGMKYNYTTVESIFDNLKNSSSKFFENFRIYHLKVPQNFGILTDNKSINLFDFDRVNFLFLCVNTTESGLFSADK